MEGGDNSKAGRNQSCTVKEVSVPDWCVSGEVDDFDDPPELGTDVAKGSSSLIATRSAVKKELCLGLPVKVNSDCPIDENFRTRSYGATERFDLSINSTEVNSSEEGPAENTSDGVVPCRVVKFSMRTAAQLQIDVRCWMDAWVNKKSRNQKMFVERFCIGCPHEETIRTE